MKQTGVATQRLATSTDHARPKASSSSRRAFCTGVAGGLWGGVAMGGPASWLWPSRSWARVSQSNLAANFAQPGQGIPRDTHSGASSLNIDLPQLRYPGQWQPYRDVMRSLGSALRLRTRIEAVATPSIVKLDDPKLFDTPFLYIAGRDTLPTLSPRERARLRRFVDIGGLLVFDDAGGGIGRNFRQSLQTWVDAITPSSKLAPLPADHVLYRSFYLVSTPTGRTVHQSHAQAVLDEGRIKILLIPNDLGGALARGPDERYLIPCQPGGEVQREWAIRFGVNILLYATCTDYKSDPAHVQTLLRSRQWR